MNDTFLTNFEWDEVKSDACYLARGFDFAYAIRAFLDSDRVVRQDARRNYGEERYQLMGKTEGRLFVWVYTQRHDAIRIVSARTASQREVKQYESHTRDD